MSSTTIYTESITPNKVLPYVYRLDNPVTKEFYIGYRKANTLPAEHDLPLYKSSSKQVHNRFDEFNWVILAEFFDSDDAYDYEQLTIFEEWNNPLLLNKSCYHNKGRFNRNDALVSKQTRAKMSESAKNRPPISDETRKKMSIASTGRIQPPKSEETRLKISLSKTGGKQTTDSNEKRSKALLNKPKSISHKDNMKKPKSQMHRNNIAKATAGLTTVFDFIELKCVKIHRDEYQAHKGTRYAALNSSIYRSFKETL